MPTAELHFPYMFWAHREAVRSRWCLSQSGMPAPEAPWLERAGLADLGHPDAGAAPLLAARLAEFHGVPAERVLLVPGASSGMFLAAMRWFRPGSRVLVELPSYEPLRALPRFLGAELRTIERRRPAAGGSWELDPGDVERQLGTGAGPAHVFVTNPNNPTMAMQPAADIAALAAAAGRRGGVLVSCEVYMEFAPRAARVHAALIAPNAVSISSFTKACGLGALRLGWMILGAGLAAEREALLDLTYLAWVDPPTPSLRAGLAALDHLPELDQRVRANVEQCRPILARWLERTPGVRGLPPVHGLTSFAAIEGVPDTRALARRLQAEHEVDTVPGEFFGLPGHLRIGCGLAPDLLGEGLDRLARGIEAFRRAPGA